jgi:hypothetical protein
MCRLVVEQADDSAADPWQGATRVGSPRVRKILHFTSVSASKPFRSLNKLWEFFCPDHPAAIKAYGFCLFHNPRGFENWAHETAGFIWTIVEQT